MSEKLSVTIVAYKDYEDIKEAVRTLEKYTSAGLVKHIYIVDNGASVSDEKAIKSFRKFVSQYADVEYCDTGQNLGFGKGHNYIISRLKSEYHAIVNPDILFCEDAFTKILKYMDDNLDVGMCIPNITNEEGERQLVYRKELTIFDMFIRMFCKQLFPGRIRNHTLQNKDYTKEFPVPFGQGSFLIIRTALFKALNGFDDHFFMYLEDADLCKRVNQVSKLMYFPGATVIHKWKMGSHNSKKLFKYHVNSMKYYFKKWGYKIF